MGRRVTDAFHKLEDGVTDGYRAVEKTVELLAGSLKGCLTAEDLERCARKIRAHTRS